MLCSKTVICAKSQASESERIGILAQLEGNVRIEAPYNFLRELDFGLHWATYVHKLTGSLSNEGNKLCVDDSVPVGRGVTATGWPPGPSGCG